MENILLNGKAHQIALHKHLSVNGKRVRHNTSSSFVLKIELVVLCHNYAPFGSAHLALAWYIFRARLFTCLFPWSPLGDRAGFWPAVVYQPWCRHLRDLTLKSVPKVGDCIKVHTSENKSNQKKNVVSYYFCYVCTCSGQILCHHSTVITSS